MSRLIVVTLMTWAIASTTHGAAVIDEVNLPAANGGSLNDLCCEWEQQVTAGVAGPLAGIELFGLNPAEHVQIGLGNAYTAGPFAFSTVVAMSDTGTYIDASSANITLSVGESFVIDVTPTQTGAVGLRASSSSVGPAAYSGGDLYFNDAGAITPVDFSGPTYLYEDMAFVTYVGDGPPTSIVTVPPRPPAPPPPPPPGVPEPASWVLLMAGLFGMGALVRRQGANTSA